MAWALVQSKIMQTLADPGGTTFDSTPTTGNLLLAVTHNTTNTSIPTVSDSGGNWTILVGTGVSGANSQSIFGKIAVSSQPTAISCDVGAATTGMSLYEFSGNYNDVSTIVHQSSSGPFTSVTTTSGGPPSITTTTAGCLIFTTLGTNNTITGPSLSDGTFTAGQAGPSGAIESVDYYKLDAATGTYNPSFTWTTSRSAHQLIVALLPAATGSTAGLLPILW